MNYQERKMAKYIFVIACFVSLFFQGIRWFGTIVTDDSVWAHEAQYVQEGDAEQFGIAYAYPSTTIIYGTIAVHNLLKISYENSLKLFLTIFNSLIIAGAGTLCFLIRKNSWWWIFTLGMLALNRLYDHATPPSAVAIL